MVANLYRASTTAGSNTTIDAVSVAEGMSPSGVNDALRALVAGVKGVLDVVSGAKTSGGTANAQTVTTGLSFSTLAAGDVIAFKAGSGLTNTGAMTLAVDSASAANVKLNDGSDPYAGAVTAGGIYVVCYDGTNLKLINPGPGGTFRGVLKDYGETVNVIGSIGGGTQDIDLEFGNVVSGTVDTSATTFTFSNPPASGIEGKITLYLTNGGSQTVNWPASVDWPGATAPTLTTSGVDILVFTTIDGGTIWNGFVAGQAMA